MDERSHAEAFGGARILVGAGDERERDSGRYAKHCPCHGSVDAAAIVRGYEYGPGQHLVVEVQARRLRTQNAFLAHLARRSKIFASTLRLADRRTPFAK